MKTLMRWLGLVLSLIVARILLALAILAGIIFLISTGLQSLGLPIPTAAQIEQRLQPAAQQIAPLLQRLRPQNATSTPTDGRPVSGPAQA